VKDREALGRSLVANISLPYLAIVPTGHPCNAIFKVNNAKTTNEELQITPIAVASHRDSVAAVGIQQVALLVSGHRQNAEDRYRKSMQK
jgi:hypothetical protein